MENNFVQVESAKTYSSLEVLRMAKFMIGESHMPFLSIRRGLSFGWFCLLVILTAGIIVSADSAIGSLQHALSYHLLTTLVISIPIALLAAGPLILFRRRYWVRGLLTALGMGIIVYGVLYMWQTTPSSQTLQEMLRLLPRAVGILGGWLILVSLPPALLFSRR